MTKLEKVTISHNFNFKGVVVVFVPVQERFAENITSVMAFVE